MNVTTREDRLIDFLHDAENDNMMAAGGYARLHVKHAIIQSGYKQIRSKKHNADAVVFDVLGNVTALYPNGAIRQYVTESEIKKAGILR